MRITIFYRYFWPDTTPYAVMLREMAQWFSGAGHDVEVISGQPAYKPSVDIPMQAWRENIGGVEIRRIWLFKERGRRVFKAINYFLFILRSFFIVLLGPRRDVIVAGTTPPVLQASALSLAAKIRGSKFVYHLQDIHPEIVSVKKGKLVKNLGFYILQRMDIATNKRAYMNVVIDQDLGDVLTERGTSPSNVRVIRNFSVNKSFANCDDKIRDPDDPVRFIFAGNIGVFQNLENLVSVFAKLDAAEVKLVLVGEGRAKEKIKRIIENQGIKNVDLHDYMTTDDVFDFLRQHDVGVVSLVPGIYKYAFPSKVWTYLAAGLPMLSMVEKESGLAKFLEKNNFGSSTGWESTQTEIAVKIMTMAKKVRENDFSVSQKKHLFNCSTAERNWIDFFNDFDREKT